MEDSEKFLAEINSICIEKNIGIFEATLIFAEKYNIDIEEVVASLDSHTIDKLKVNALDDNLVCNRNLFTQKYDQFEPLF